MITKFHDVRKFPALLQTLLFSLFLSKVSSEYNRIFCGSFSSMLIGLAEGSGPSDLMTKIARIRHAVGEDVEQV